MQDLNTSVATISIPFLFLKLKGTKDTPKKRIIFPQTFSLLLKNAKALFQDLIEVKSLFDEGGEQVTGIEQVLPGSTIYVSSIDPNDYEPYVTNKPPKTPTKDSKGIMSKDSFQRLFGTEDPDQDQMQPKDNFDGNTLSLDKDSQDQQQKQDQNQKPRTKYTPKSERMKKLQEGEKKKQSSKIPSKSNVVAANSPSNRHLKEVSSLYTVPQKLFSSSSRLDDHAKDDFEVVSPKNSKGNKKNLSQAARLFQRGALVNEDEEDKNVKVFDDENQTELAKRPKKKLSTKQFSTLPEAKPASPAKKDILKFPSPSSQKQNEEPIPESPKNTQKTETISENASTDSPKEKKVISKRGVNLDQDDEDEQTHNDSYRDKNSAKKNKNENNNKDKNANNKKSNENTSLNNENGNKTGIQTDENEHTPRRGKKSQIPTNSKSPATSEVSVSNISKPPGNKKLTITINNSRPATDASSVASEPRSLNGNQTKAAKDNSSKDNSTKDNSTKDNSTKDNSTKDNSTKDNSTKDKASKDKAPKDKVSQNSDYQIQENQNNENQNNDSQNNENQNYYDDDNNDEEESDYSIDEENKDLQNLINETVEKGALQGVLAETLEEMPDCSDSLQKLPSLENQQKCHWYQKGIQIAEQQNLAPLTENSFGVNEMIGRVRCFLVDHRFPTRGGVSHRLNVGIIGPQQSGKSAFLRIFTEELLADLISTGAWKDTFVFILDLCNIISYTSNYIQFYHAIVETTMQCIAWQIPRLIPYIGLIQKTFEDVTSYSKPPKFGKAFMLNPETQKVASELQIIINKLSTLWNEEEALSEWITSIIYFPMVISKALGIKKCIYILDHYDIADVVLQPMPSKFSESPSHVVLIDVLNYALLHCNFVVACSNQHDFLNTIEPVPTEGTTKAQFELISTINLMQETTYGDKQLNVTFNDDTFPTNFTCDICGGIPLYQHVWNEINEMLDEIEKNEENAEELNEALNAHVQTAMKYFFADEDGEQRIHEVIAVRRKTIKSNTDDQSKENNNVDY